jgi:uncharacterized HAD superfamily protein
VNVYVDVDDVLSETTRSICELLERRTGRVVDYRSLESFELGESLRLAPDELRDFMDAIHSDDHLGALAPLDGAAETLDGWSARGAHIAVLTGRPPQAHAVTRAWLERHQMPFDRLDSVDKYGRFTGGVHFDEILRERFAWAIEDNLDVALKLAERCAERVLLLDRPWNRGPLPGAVERVADWTEIARRVR